MDRTHRIAPEIFRQRLLIEGYYTKPITRESLSTSLLEIAARLDLRTYADPIVFTPESGMGKDENAGFDAFVPLVDSGISAYVWSKAHFLSILLYTCKAFDEAAAIGAIQHEFGLAEGAHTRSF